MYTQIIEHIGLFKIKPKTDPSNLTSITNRINSLVSLPHVLHLSMGPIHKLQSPPSLTFTHMLHARYNSMSDLDAFTVHPDHVAVVKANAPFVDDAMALDWIAGNHRGDLALPPGTAVKVRFLKLRDESVKDDVLRVVGGVKDKFGRQFSVGENFSPARAKGFSIGSLVVFGGTKELEVDLDEKDKIDEYVEEEIVVGYVVPSCEV